MHFITNKKIYNNVLIFLVTFLSLFIVYKFAIILRHHYTPDKTVTEPFGLKRIRRGLKKGFKKAKSGISKAAESVAKKAAEEAKRVAEETKKAAEQARRMAEEAAQAIQIQNAIKELKRSVNRTSDIFETISSNVSEIKGLGSSYTKSVTNFSNAFDKL